MVYLVKILRMKPHLSLGVALLLLACQPKEPSTPVFKGVKIDPIAMDSLSIRAIELMEGNLVFAANHSRFGMLQTRDMTVKSNAIKGLAKPLEFRAVAHTSRDFFMLSVENPAMLYKTGDQGQMELVYSEEADGVFYDALTFFDNQYGIAVGDAVGGCLSLLRTTDGGQNWTKIPCEDLPEGIADEGAYAASNTNIKTIGSEAWVATTAGNMYYSADFGAHWTRFQTAVQNESIEAYGVYSIDFWNAKEGIAYGGSFLSPEDQSANIALTYDGGKRWELVAQGANPGYKSCVQYVPGTKGQGVIAIGFTGISYSSDGGLHWKSLSEEPFYTIRFQDTYTAYAAGKGRIARLEFYE